MFVIFPAPARAAALRFLHLVPHLSRDPPLEQPLLVPNGFLLGRLRHLVLLPIATHLAQADEPLHDHGLPAIHQVLATLARHQALALPHLHRLLPDLDGVGRRPTLHLSSDLRSRGCTPATTLVRTVLQILQVTYQLHSTSGSIRSTTAYYSTARPHPNYDSTTVSYFASATQVQPSRSPASSGSFECSSR